MIKLVDKTDLDRIRQSDLNYDQKIELIQEIRDETDCMREALRDLACPQHPGETAAATVHLRLMEQYRLYYDVTDECCEKMLELIPAALAPCLRSIHSETPSHDSPDEDSL